MTAERVAVERHVHGEWTWNSPTHQDCERAGWWCARCSQGHDTDPGPTGCVGCGSTRLWGLWKLADR